MFRVSNIRMCKLEKQITSEKWDTAINFLNSKADRISSIVVVIEYNNDDFNRFHVLYKVEDEFFKRSISLPKGDIPKCTYSIQDFYKLSKA